MSKVGCLIVIGMCLFSQVACTGEKSVTYLKSVDDSNAGDMAVEFAKKTCDIERMRDPSLPSFKVIGDASLLNRKVIEEYWTHDSVYYAKHVKMHTFKLASKSSPCVIEVYPIEKHDYINLATLIRHRYEPLPGRQDTLWKVKKLPDRNTARLVNNALGWDKTATKIGNDEIQGLPCQEYRGKLAHAVLTGCNWSSGQEAQAQKDPLSVRQPVVLVLRRHVVDSNAGLNGTRIAEKVNLNARASDKQIYPPKGLRGKPVGNYEHIPGVGDDDGKWEMVE